MPATTELPITDTLVPVQCFYCGVWSAVPATVYEHARRHGPDRNIYCPNGHAWHFIRKDPDYRLERANPPTIVIASIHDLRPPAPRLDPPKPKPPAPLFPKQCPWCLRHFHSLRAVAQHKRWCKERPEES